MTILLVLVLRVSVVLVLALLAAVLMRRQSAARRHLLLAAGLAGALLVGPLSWIAPAWAPLPVMATVDPMPVLDAVAVDIAAEPGPSTSGTPRAWSLMQALLLFWLAGSVTRATWLGVTLVRLAGRTRTSRPPGGHWAADLPELASMLGVVPDVRVRATPAIPSPAAWGWRAPVILLPEEAASWDRPRVRMVLLHELAHIARRDWLVQMLGELALIAYWWHPLIWQVRAWLRRAGECACDDLVLRAGVPGVEYGATLFDIARRHARATFGPAVVGMAHPSSLERRITAMLDQSLDRRPLTRRAAVLSAGVLAVILAPLAALTPRAQEAGRGLVVQVFDPTGAVLPGVTIALASTQGSQDTTTEGSGRATFADVADGEYTLTASVPGFRTLKGPFVVKSARDRQRSITLQVGELEETVSVRARRPTAPPPAQTVVEPLRVGGNIKAPRKLRHVSPEYPASMRDAGLEGVVPMEALIARDGTVASVRIVSADVHPEFARAASDAVSQWQFSPTLLNGEAVEVRMSATVRFSLED